MYIPDPKPIVFLGKSLEAVRAFPAVVRRRAGYELDKVQRGSELSDWKPMRGVGPGVREIRIRARGEWRVVHVANRNEAVYVLHAFRKKTQRTSQRDIEIIVSAFKEIG